MILGGCRYSASGSSVECRRFRPGSSLNNYRFGLTCSTVLLVAWAVLVYQIQVTLGPVGSLLSAPVSLICAVGILMALVDARPELPNPAGVALRMVGFAAGISLAYPFVPWLAGLEGTTAAAAATGMGDILYTVVYLPMGLMSTSVAGLWGAHVVGMLDRDEELVSDRHAMRARLR